MAHSYLLAGALAGMQVVVISPEKYATDAGILARAQQIAQKTGGSVVVSSDLGDVAGADVLATDTWVSMGQEDQKAQRIADFAGFCIDAGLLAKAKPDAIVLHCLPAYRGYEISAEVLDGPQAVIWDEAENRLHAQKALMVWLAEHAK
jgi:ornithine carbamoyltransferase